MGLIPLTYISETPTVLAALEAQKTRISQKSCDGAGRFTISLSWCLLLVGKQGFRDVGVCSH